MDDPSRRRGVEATRFVRRRGVDATRFVATRPSAVQFVQSAAPDPAENVPGAQAVCSLLPAADT